MKKILTSIVVLSIFAIAGFSQATTTSTTGPKMKLESMVVDYGTIEKNGEPFRTVKFTNVGDEPLIIKTANGNCGCTVPTWPREAVNPGQSSEIKIRYATDRVGQINKKVTITTNENADNTHVIDVKGNVLPGKDDVAPTPAPVTPAEGQNHMEKKVTVAPAPVQSPAAKK